MSSLKICDIFITCFISLFLLPQGMPALYAIATAVALENTFSFSSTGQFCFLFVSHMNLKNLVIGVKVCDFIIQLSAAGWGISADVSFGENQSGFPSTKWEKFSHILPGKLSDCIHRINQEYKYYQSIYFHKPLFHRNDLEQFIPGTFFPYTCCCLRFHRGLTCVKIKQTVCWRRIACDRSSQSRAVSQYQIRKFQTCVARSLDFAIWLRSVNSTGRCKKSG